MRSGLYGDLPAAKAEAEAPAKPVGWASSGPLRPPPARKTPVAPPIVLRRAAAPQPAAAAQSARRSSGPALVAHASSAAVVLGAAGSLSAAVQEEYDPARPNDYEEVRRQREIKRKQEELDEKRRVLEQQRKEVEARRRESEALANAGSAEALDMTGEEAYARRARMSGFSAASGPDNGAEASSSGRQGGSGGGGLTMAQRMMQKMGWKEGQGLGKDGQGISTPLIMQKTDNNSHGVIVSGAPLAGSIPEKRRKNMVGPGEVDEELEDEVAGECEKFGPVVRCLIFEVLSPPTPEDAVRIFVEFTQASSAAKALQEMNGRFFGGRNLQASFFDEGKFERQELC